MITLLVSVVQMCCDHALTLKGQGHILHQTSVIVPDSVYCHIKCEKISFVVTLTLVGPCSMANSSKIFSKFIDLICFILIP